MQAISTRSTRDRERCKKCALIIPQTSGETATTEPAVDDNVKKLAAEIAEKINALKDDVKVGEIAGVFDDGVNNGDVEFALNLMLSQLDLLNPTAVKKLMDKINTREGGNLIRNSMFNLLSYNSTLWSIIGSVDRKTLNLGYTATSWAPVTFVLVGFIVIGLKYGTNFTKNNKETTISKIAGWGYMGDMWGVATWRQLKTNVASGASRVFFGDSEAEYGEYVAASTTPSSEPVNISSRVKIASKTIKHLLKNTQVRDAMDDSSARTETEYRKQSSVLGDNWSFRDRGQVGLNNRLAYIRHLESLITE